MRPERSWLNTLDISQIALSYTGESIRKLLEIADDVVTHYVFPLGKINRWIFLFFVVYYLLKKYNVNFR